jgi:cell division protein FtsI/penicillin-binding protein 2
VRSTPPALAALVAAALLPLAACSSGPKPEPVARDFLAAWARGDAAGAARLTDAPAPAQAALAAARTALGVDAAQLRLRRVQRDGDDATAGYAAAFTLRGLGTWRYDGRLELRRRDDAWRVHWTATALHPRLAAGQRLGRSRALPHRAPLLDRTGAALLTPQQVVTVSILPSAVRDRAGLLGLLQRRLGVDPKRVAVLLDAAKPDQLVPVIPLRRGDYDKVRDAIHDVPGLRFPTSMRLLAPTPTFARALLGRVGTATAEALQAAGSGYQAGDEVGLSGLQAAFQRRLAGSASGAVVIRDATGATVRVLQDFPGKPGEAVQTTLERRVQEAAEAVLDGATRPAALVAVRPSDGAVLAVANRPADSSFNRAFAGRYPPGSTFKIATTTALLGEGLTPADPVPCPPTVTVLGRTFRNFEGEAAGRVSFARDFAISCNTAFIAAARQRLQAADLQQAAKRLGVGAGWSLPVSAYDGAVPTPKDDVELVADAIGQGRVSVSPLGMALVAAAVQNGTWRPPVLVTDPAQPASAARPAPLAAASQLRALMRSVVSSGTAAPAFRSYSGPPVSGKTGTAEFGTDTPPRTHAWFVGFRGDLAVAVVVEGGGVGGRTAAPLAARFFARL